MDRGDRRGAAGTHGHVHRRQHGPGHEPRRGGARCAQTLRQSQGNARARLGRRCCARTREPLARCAERLPRFRQEPGFAFVVVATLALGIGANTAIFEMLDAVLLQSLPVRNPQELAQVRVVNMDKARGKCFKRLPGGNQSNLGEAARRSPGFLRNRCVAGTSDFLVIRAATPIL